MLDYVAVRRNMGWWFAAGQPVEALVVDDTSFPKDGSASPCVAWQYSGTLGETANCQVAVSVHLVNGYASCAADWRLFCPQSWDDTTLEDPGAAARAACRRERAGIPDQVRHTEKWRLAGDDRRDHRSKRMNVLNEITCAGGARAAVTGDASTTITPPSSWSWLPTAGGWCWLSGAPPARTRATRSR
jgi:hypothetical protein